MLEGARGVKDCGGYYGWTLGEQAVNTDRVAIIGRDSETKYDLDIKGTKFVQEIEKIKGWALSDPKPKTLVIDITIPTDQKVDPILQSVIDMRNELTYAEKKGFDLLVVRSEQKQQSLGTGKYAAGACFLVTDDEKRREDFDSIAQHPRRPDEMLATFYRENLWTQMHKMVKEQCQVAVELAKEHSGKRAIPNGPFVLLDRDSDLACDDGFAKKNSFSFGFAEETNASWNHSIRISAGAKGPEGPPLRFTKDDVARMVAIKFISRIEPRCHGFWLNKKLDHADWNLKTIAEVANGDYCRGPTPESGANMRKILASEFNLEMKLGMFTEKAIHIAINKFMESNPDSTKTRTSML